jgi:hypothetical protein
LQIHPEIIGHCPALEKLIELHLVEIVEQAMEIDRLDVLLGQGRHVLNEKPHAANAVLAFTDDRPGAALNTFGINSSAVVAGVTPGSGGRGGNEAVNSLREKN